MSASQMFREFSIPIAQSGAAAITAGPDGNLWFTETNANMIGRITPAGVITEFPVPTPAAGLGQITAGADGNLWFIESHANKIGRITPTGVITEFPVPTAGVDSLTGITRASDGNVWFTERLSDQFARITPNGTITEFPYYPPAQPSAIAGGDLIGLLLGFIDAGPSQGVVGVFPGPDVLFQGTVSGGVNSSSAIAAGPDGNLWFTETSGKIGRTGFTQARYTEFDTGATGPLLGITPGPDGNEWFTEAADNQIAQITPSGTVTQFPIPTANSYPSGITAGPDGNIWFVESQANQIGVYELATGGPNGRYVSELYRVLLNRPADPQGQANFQAALDSGQATQTQVAQAILNSPQYEQDEVTQLYQKTLGRAPDPGGLTASVNFLAAGNSSTQLEAILLGSAEYFSDAGSTNSGFVTALYQTVLGRAPDPAGAQGFTQELTNGVSRTTVALQVLASSEAAGIEVEHAYQTLLGRTADPSGLAAGIALLENGGSIQQLDLKLVTSPEFIASVNGDANQLFVTQIYYDLLGRAPDGVGLAAYVNLLDAETLTRQQVALAIETSTEFQTDEVEHLYQAVLDRPADPGGLAASVAFLQSGGTGAELEAILLSSDEFFNVEGGGTDSGFLSALYQVVLGRAIDSSGAQNFGQELANGTPRSTIVAEVLYSTESETDEVQKLYQEFLRRSADPGGLTNSLAFLQQGGSSEQLAAIIVGSSEYLDRL